MGLTVASERRRHLANVIAIAKAFVNWISERRRHWRMLLQLQKHKLNSDPSKFEVTWQKN